MKSSHLIPSELLDLAKQCTTRVFKRTEFTKLAYSSPNLVKWFKSLNEQYQTDIIDPLLVYETSIKHGLTEYTPKCCATCGKVLKIRAVRENRPFCSTSCNLRSPVTQAKRKANFLKKYGTTSHFHAKEVQDKIKSTLISRYGVDNIAKFEESKQRKINRLKKKYGVINVFQLESVKERIIPAIRKTQHKKFYQHFLAMLKYRNVEMISNEEDYLNLKPIVLHCKNCSTTWITQPNGQAVHISICPSCLEQYMHANSKVEKELLLYIKTLYSGEILENKRNIIKPYELDIYLPKKRLAFEFNGNYWHSENVGVKNNYHYLKSHLCNKKHIRLIHIFEYEWVFNQEKIKNLIKSALGIFDVRLYARHCIIKEISSEDYKLFLLENHLQGAVNSSVRYGLFYDDKLISVIGFGKSRFKKDEIELHRYCVKAGYQIVGGFSKLIKHACKTANISKFTSYIDLAHFTGRGYKKIGFVKDKVTRPSYIYLYKDKILTRMQCQKHKLPKLLGSQYNKDLSETENMILAKYQKIYDCGMLKVVYNYKVD